ncbi:MAG TPA: IS21 family transposase [Chitinophagales bacterium]|nr:IS21 family transposase [Chitinophagales bacterium]
MHQIKHIIELQLQGKSIRQTERLTGIARNTIREYLRKIKARNIALEQMLMLDDESLSAVLYREDIPVLHRNERHRSIAKEMEYFSAELHKRGVTRQLLWEEYRKENPDGYGYSQFCEHLGRHLKRSDAVMHFTHQPGEQMQVDFAGDKLHYIDRSTGELIGCEVLVCVLPYSNYSFAIALRSQKQEEFIRGICAALEYMGGVPQSIKCDNLRSAVSKSNRYEPQFTEAMEYVATHYGTTVLASRVRKPRDKGSVEKAVDLSYKRIYAPLRHHNFFSIEQLNASIREQLEQHNSRLFKGKNYSRKKLFEEEKKVLKELPVERYEIRHITYGKVQRNYHVIVGEDYHQYSVPFTLIGKRLKIVYTADTVEIYDAMKRVAIHKRDYKKHGYSTNAEHMPAHHRHQFAAKGWNAEYFEQLAAAVGTSTLEVIKRILSSKFFYEQTYNSCLGILRLGKQYTNERLEAACQRALASPVINYRTIANILKNNMDKQATLFDTADAAIPEHDQLRGPSAYK